MALRGSTAYATPPDITNTPRRARLTPVPRADEEAKSNGHRTPEAVTRIIDGPGIYTAATIATENGQVVLPAEARAALAQPATDEAPRTRRRLPRPETISSARDYVTDMRTLMDRMLDESSEPRDVIANRLVEHLRAEDPALLAGWLDAQAVQLVRSVLATIERSDKAAARVNAGKHAFEQAVTEHAAGNPDRLVKIARFLDNKYVLEGGVRKPLKELTPADLEYVAGKYDRRASQNALQAAFMRSIAKRLRPGQMVSSLFTDEQLADMWVSMSR